jgi:hypothetical protein
MSKWIADIVSRPRPTAHMTLDKCGGLLIHNGGIRLLLHFAKEFADVFLLICACWRDHHEENKKRFHRLTDPRRSSNLQIAADFVNFNL